MRWCVFVVVAVACYLSSAYGMSPYGATGRPSGSSGGSASAGQTGTGGSGSAQGSAGSFTGTGSSAATQGSAATGAGSVGGSFGSGSRPAAAVGADFGAFGSFAGTTGFRGSGQALPSGGPAFSGGSSFASSVLQQQVTPTVTQTVTVDNFVTLTDLVLNSVGVTLTQFLIETATRPLGQVVVTPVDDRVAITTTVLQRPQFVTVTETKSDFRLLVKTSVTHATLTHTSYTITHVPFTITATETVQITSPMVRTVISTQRQVVTDYRTLVNTVYVHGGYH